MRPLLPGALGDLERRFRRRFVETHELLGRGRVLTAFEEGEDAYLDRIAARRIAAIERRLSRTGDTLYVDVSKYFGRGLYRGFLRALDDVSLILLVRDPVLNMRSFLNRDKNFRLDNADPNGVRNALRLDGDDLDKGELYLWAWCEMYLRFERMVDEFAIGRAVEIRTEHLTDAKRMADALDRLDLPHGPLEGAAPANTNAAQGYGETRVRRQDISTFERFRDRLPKQVRRQIRYFDDYSPEARHGDVAGAAVP